MKRYNKYSIMGAYDMTFNLGRNVVKLWQKCKDGQFDEADVTEMNAMMERLKKYTTDRWEESP